MATFFLTCALLGGGILVLQLVLSAFGFDAGSHDASFDLGGHHAIGHAHVGDGLSLLSVRAMSAGVAFFGVAGWGALGAGWHVALALAAAAAVGFGAMVTVAVVMRSLLKLEDDGAVRLEHAIGQGGTVYVPIPGQRTGTGKVMLTLQSRTVECRAVTPDGPLATGTPVTVVDVRGPDLLEVVPTSDTSEVR